VNIPPLEGLTAKDPTHGSKTLTSLAIFGNQRGNHFLGKMAEADKPWSNGDHHEVPPQRPPSSFVPPFTPLQGVVETTNASNLIHLTQVPPQTSLFSRTSYTLFTNVGLGFGLRGLDVIVAR
jgi:hypothetical protein